MPKIYFIPLLFTGSFAGDNWDHCGRGSSAVWNHLWYCTVDWCGGSAIYLTSQSSTKDACDVLNLVDVDNQFFKDYADLFFSDK